MPKITVFTPAYNRAHTLTRTYESLCNQTCKDFIWMIIDDGSRDNTTQLVSEWQKNCNGFEIEYYYKKNGGMHTAHNMAYEKITTELNVCIDSDDAMPPNAIEMILTFWERNGSDEVGGIIALDSDFNGVILGSRLPQNIDKLTTEDLYSKYKTIGDKKFIYRTDVIRAVEPYPEFPGEKLVPLGYKYVQVAQKYPMLLLDNVVCFVDYQPDGSTNTIMKQYLESPRGFAISKRQRMIYEPSIKAKVKCTIHYIAECMIAKDSDWLHNSPKKLMTLLLYPIGLIVMLYIKANNKKKL